MPPECVRMPSSGGFRFPRSLALQRSFGCSLDSCLLQNANPGIYHRQRINRERTCAASRNPGRKEATRRRPPPLQAPPPGGLREPPVPLAGWLSAMKSAGQRIERESPESPPFPGGQLPLRPRSALIDYGYLFPPFCPRDTWHSHLFWYQG